MLRTPVIDDARGTLLLLLTSSLSPSLRRRVPRTFYCHRRCLACCMRLAGCQSSQSSPACTRCFQLSTARCAAACHSMARQLCLHSAAATATGSVFLSAHIPTRPAPGVTSACCCLPPGAAQLQEYVLEASSDATCARWCVNEGLVRCLTIEPPEPAVKLETLSEIAQVRCALCAVR